MQADVRPAGLRAALAPVVAAVELATVAVLVDGHESSAQPTADLARQVGGGLRSIVSEGGLVP